jgi:hypothetical protein
MDNTSDEKINVALYEFGTRHNLVSRHVEKNTNSLGLGAQLYTLHPEFTAICADRHVGVIVNNIVMRHYSH